MQAPYSSEFLDAKRQGTDPLAELTLELMLREDSHLGTARVFSALTQDIDMHADSLPKTLQDFVAYNQELPEWAEPAKLERASRFFQDHAPTFLTMLYFRSLPTLYACADGARTLQLTGRLMPPHEGYEVFTRRIAETGNFLLTVMAPGALLPGGKGLDTVLRVRMIHASVRLFMPADRWDARWGEPINQEDMAITLMTFCTTMLDGLDRLGIAYTEAEAAAYLHAWNVVGHFMGLDEDLLPADVTAGRALLQTILARQMAPSEAGSALTDALVQYTARALPGKVFDNAGPILIRYLCGDAMADLLDVKVSYGLLTAWLPGILRNLFRIVERVEDLAEPVEVFFNRVSLKLAERMVGHFDQS